MLCDTGRTYNISAQATEGLKAIDLLIYWHNRGLRPLNMPVESQTGDVRRTLRGTGVEDACNTGNL
jgi:hypothetical protein